MCAAHVLWKCDLAVRNNFCVHGALDKLRNCSALARLAIHRHEAVANSQRAIIVRENALLDPDNNIGLVEADAKRRCQLERRNDRVNQFGRSSGRC